MKKAISTKQALLFASIVWILCLSMFVGTSMAWLSDSVTSGSNVIQAGTLDARFEYRTDSSQDWATVTSSSLFDKNTDWVSHPSQTVYLRVTNKGSLPLRYTIATVITSETGSTNVEGKPYKLSEYLKVSASSVSNTQTNEALLTATGAGSESTDTSNSPKIGAPVVENRELAVDGSEIWKLTITLPNDPATASATNPATETKPSITFSVVLAAMQVSKDDVVTTAVSTVEELRNALSNDGTVVLKNDITLTEAVTVSKNTVLDLNGHTLSNVNANENANENAIENDDLKKYSAIILANGGSLTVRNSSTKNAGEIYSESAYAVYTSGTSGTSGTSEPKRPKMVLESGILDSGNNRALYLSNTDFAMTGGTVKGMALYGGCEAQISGGTIEYSLLLSEGTLTVTGGKVTGSTLLSGSNAKASILSDAFSGTIVLTGATLNISDGDYSGKLSLTGGSLNISGGDFRCEFSVTENISPAIKITGGSFPFDPSPYIETGYKVIQSENGIWTVVPATAEDSGSQG